MVVKQLFAKKSIHVLLEEMAGEHRLRRVLGPVTLSSLGIGAIIGAGSVVTADVEADALALARGKQEARPGWAKRFRARMQERKAKR